jgi:hypothetical protein
VKIINLEGTQHRFITAGVEGAEPMAATYDSGKMFRPTRVRLEWFRKDWPTEEATGWLLDNARVSGPVLKRDGGDGKQQTHHTFVQFGDPSGSDPPEWLRLLIKIHEVRYEENSS